MGTLGIREEHSSLLSKTNSRIINKPPKKKKNNLVMENYVMGEFVGDVEDNSDNGSDEVERYPNTKISFTKDVTG